MIRKPLRCKYRNKSLCFSSKAKKNIEYRFGGSRFAAPLPTGMRPPSTCRTDAQNTCFYARTATRSPEPSPREYRAAAVAVCITIYFAVNTIRHVLTPGADASTVISPAVAPLCTKAVS